MPIILLVRDLFNSQPWLTIVRRGRVYITSRLSVGRQPYSIWSVLYPCIREKEHPQANRKGVSKSECTFVFANLNERLGKREFEWLWTGKIPALQALYYQYRTKGVIQVSSLRERCLGTYPTTGLCFRSLTFRPTDLVPEDSLIPLLVEVWVSREEGGYFFSKWTLDGYCLSPTQATRLRRERLTIDRRLANEHFWQGKQWVESSTYYVMEFLIPQTLNKLRAEPFSESFDSDPVSTSK